MTTARDFVVPATKPIDPLLTTEQIAHAEDIERTIIRQGERQPALADDPRTKLTPEERAKRKAFLVQAFDRGIVHDRLTVPLPRDMHGEWCRNDPLEIDRLKTIGFEVYQREEGDDYRRNLNSDGTDALIVADVIFMVTPRENKEIIDEIRMEKFMAMNGKPGDRKAKTREEKEFESNVQRDSKGDIPIETFSKTENRINRADVEAALAQVDAQTQPPSQSRG